MRLVQEAIDKFDKQNVFWEIKTGQSRIVNSKNAANFNQKSGAWKCQKLVSSVIIMNQNANNAWVFQIFIVIVQLSVFIERY